MQPHQAPKPKGHRTRKRPFSSVANQNGLATPPRTAPPPPFTPKVQTLGFSSFATKDTPRFADLEQQNIIDQTLLSTITQDLKFDHMMPVQAATLHELLVNKIDCLAQAKTGTGKTIGFLVPAIQNMINSRQRRTSEVSTLILSPTRELAMQIAKEANALVQRLPQFSVQIAIGGTNKDSEARKIANGCQILVATPGRLLDHMGDADFRQKFKGLQTLVLDEADRMLDMGFLPDIQKIVRNLPAKSIAPRQSMLFSATIDGKVKTVAQQFLNPGYKFISTLVEGEANTHERVPQFLQIVPEFSDVAPALAATLSAEYAAVKPRPFKAIVFAPTAALADFYGHVLENLPGFPPVSVLHSRKSQTYRTRTSDAFRTSTSAICVATDVIARGMDFPGVTHVIQAGVPSEKEAYIHRLGRTARADADGRGVLILTQHERFFISQMRDIDFQDLPFAAPYNRANIQAQLATLESPGKIYQAWLGYYKSFAKSMSFTNESLVHQANVFASQGLGCAEVPGIPKSTIGKMGLKGVPGLTIAPEKAHVARGPGSGGRAPAPKPAGGRPQRPRR